MRDEGQRFPTSRLRSRPRGTARVPRRRSLLLVLPRPLPLPPLLRRRRARRRGRGRELLLRPLRGDRFRAHRSAGQLARTRHLRLRRRGMYVRFGGLSRLRLRLRLRLRRRRRVSASRGGSSNYRASRASSCCPCLAAKSRTRPGLEPAIATTAAGGCRRGLCHRPGLGRRRRRLRLRLGGAAWAVGAGKTTVRTGRRKMGCAAAPRAACSAWRGARSFGPGTGPIAGGRRRRGSRVRRPMATGLAGEAGARAAGAWLCFAYPAWFLFPLSPAVSCIVWVESKGGPCCRVAL